MKKILLVITTFFLTALIVFLSGAFITMHINPALWSDNARFFFVLGALILGFAASAGMAASLDE